MPAFRALAALVFALLLAACAPKMELSETPDPLGDFKLGYSVVVVDNPKVLPLSRKATDEEWKTVLQKAIDDRFNRFKGSGDYIIAIKLDAYALGQVGVPLIVKPRSVVAISASVWRQARKEGEVSGKINAKPEEIAVWEGVSDKSLIGSGLTQTREQQMDRLAFNAALKIEDWMRKNPDWFRSNGPVAVPLREDGTLSKPPETKDAKPAATETPAAGN